MEEVDRPSSNSTQKHKQRRFLGLKPSELQGKNIKRGDLSLRSRLQEKTGTEEIHHCVWNNLRNKDKIALVEAIRMFRAHQDSLFSLSIA